MSWALELGLDDQNDHPHVKAVSLLNKRHPKSGILMMQILGMNNRNTSCQEESPSVSQGADVTTTPLPSMKADIFSSTVKYQYPFSLCVSGILVCGTVASYYSALGLIISSRGTKGKGEKYTSDCIRAMTSPNSFT